MRWKAVTAAAALAAAVTVAIVVYLAGQPPEETPYTECRPQVMNAECVEASKMHETCESGSYPPVKAYNCRRVLELDQWCTHHLRRANAASCRMTGYNFVHCITAGGGAVPCYVVEMKFIGCLETGQSDLAGCKEQHVKAADCMPLEGVPGKPPWCKEIIDDIYRSPKPTSWRDPATSLRKPL
jgi:hypothetical protein